MRETVEALVIAFVLAFLIRTFEVEAFVIPTGSMAPTLMGRHKDVICPKCGHRFQITASEEESDEIQRMDSDIQAWEGELSRLESERPRDEFKILNAKKEIANRQYQVATQDVVGGVCPVCRYVMPVSSDLPEDVSIPPEDEPVVNQPSYNGDRIIVNKYLYALTDPQRWDVVVFKFPGNAQMNYIKRLVGLPGEVIRIYQGDLFVADHDAAEDADFEIARKPPDKVLAMRQLVHDTNYDPAELFKAGWPLRWRAETNAPGWEIKTDVVGHNVQQQFVVHPQDDKTAWLRYRHFVPDDDVWQQVQRAGNLAGLPTPTPKLITDFDAYNARVSRGAAARDGQLRADPSKMGLHWVSDLLVEADVAVNKPGGELLLDLVEGGKHFTCTIDLADGKATLHIDGVDDFAPTAKTALTKPGDYHLLFANVDDQLLLWVDGSLAAFDNSTDFDADQVFGDRSRIVPQTTAVDPGDLAPVGIGARGADLVVSRLQVWRDIYYIADSWQRNHGQLVTDYDNSDPNVLFRIASEPALWSEFARRRHHDFPLSDNQFFVMGDNSPESLDARLWRGQNPRDRGRPGGAYLERDLLIGKALFVYWPHSWNRIPGTPIPFPLFPNFQDMRLVK
jgi:signal peptidase I